MEEKISETQPTEISAKPRQRWLKIVLASVLGLALAGGLFFAGYKLGKVRQETKEKPARVERKELIRCTRGNDCTLAIRLDQCCSCPQVISRVELAGAKNLVEYQSGKDYSKEKTVDCRGAVCAPCAPKRAVCEAGSCKAIFEMLVEEFCVKKETGEKMSLSEAKETALRSECITEAGLKEEHFCNENTGTWWIDLDIEREGCSPACVINVSTKKASINWRCTGLIPQ